MTPAEAAVFRQGGRRRLSRGLFGRALSLRRIRKLVPRRGMATCRPLPRGELALLRIGLARASGASRWTRLLKVRAWCPLKMKLHQRRRDKIMGVAPRPQRGRGRAHAFRTAWGWHHA